MASGRKAVAWAWALALGCAVVLVGGCAAVAASDANAVAPIKVYLMAGQSNMVGPGSVKYVAEKHPELMTPRQDVWCIDAGKISGPLKPGYGSGETAFGLELAMGHVLGDAVDNPIVLFKTSTGGTTLHKDWRSPSAVKRAGGKVGPLYTRMMRRFHNMLANPADAFPPFKDRPVELAGFVWFQGENDCCAKDESGKGFWEYYEENLKDLIKDVRREVGVPDLPVLIVQINDGCWDGVDEKTGKATKGGTIIRPIQQKVAEADPLATWIKTCDLNSGYHYDSPSHITIGERAGAALLPFIKKAVPQKPAEILAARKCFFAQFPAAGKPDTSGLGKGLLGYWRFDEGAGAAAADSSGNNIAGVLHGKPSWTAGRLGGAVKLTGGQKIEFPKFADPVTEVMVGTRKQKRIVNLSVAYWLRANRYGDGCVGKCDGDPNYGRNRHNWYYNTWANCGGWSVGCHDNGGGVYSTATFDLTLNGIHGRGESLQVIGDGFEWHHIAVIYDGARKTFDLYVDGALAPKDHISVRRSLKGIGDESHIVPSRRGKLTLGGRIALEGQYQVFDELAIWDRPLTAAEVSALYNSGHGAAITAKADKPAPVKRR